MEKQNNNNNDQEASDVAGDGKRYSKGIEWTTKDCKNIKYRKKSGTGNIQVSWDCHAFMRMTGVSCQKILECDLRAQDIMDIHVRMYVCMYRTFLTFSYAIYIYIYKRMRGKFSKGNASEEREIRHNITYRRGRFEFEGCEGV